MHPRTRRHRWRLSIAAVLVVPGAMVSCTDSSSDRGQGSDAGSSFDSSSVIDGSHQSDGSPVQDGGGLGDSTSDAASSADADATVQGDGGNGDSGDGGDAGCLPSLNPVSRWRFEGNLNDSMGGNNGTFGTVGGAVPGTFVAGKVGDALSLGGNSYFTVTNAANLQNISTISVEAWIKPMMVAGGVIFQKKLQSYGAVLFLTAAGKISFLLDGAGSFPAESVQPLLSGVWYHVVGTADGTTNRIFVDGVESGTGSQTAAATTYAQDVFVGASPVGPQPPAQLNSYYSGLVDELMFFNRALSAAEILATYQAGSLGRCP